MIHQFPVHRLELSADDAAFTVARLVWFALLHEDAYDVAGFPDDRENIGMIEGGCSPVRLSSGVFSKQYLLPTRPSAFRHASSGTRSCCSPRPGRWSHLCSRHPVSRKIEGELWA
jgi:hypothetical protein